MAIVTVRKRQHQASALEPLLLTSSQELVDNDLSSVGEITELSFPDNERVRVDERVTQFETEDTIFRQGGVGDGESTLFGADVVQESVLATVLLVVENSMTLREGTTLNILTRDTDVLALSEERAPGQSFSSRPINVLTFVQGLFTVLENTLQVAVNVEVVREGVQGLANALEGLERNTGGIVRQVLLGQFLGRLESGP